MIQTETRPLDINLNCCIWGSIIESYFTPLKVRSGLVMPYGIPWKAQVKNIVPKIWILILNSQEGT